MAGHTLYRKLLQYGFGEFGFAFNYRPLNRQVCVLGADMCRFTNKEVKAPCMSIFIPVRSPGV